MKVIPTKEFNKTVSKITDKIAKKRLGELTAKLEAAESLSEIPHVLPIENEDDLYRITTGNYRLLIKRLKNGEIIILLVDYRRRNEKTYRGIN
jgi:mRNA-degrading endonuclease RelE of RelBE toxin-antitoxin system